MTKKVCQYSDVEYFFVNPPDIIPGVCFRDAKHRLIVTCPELNKKSVLGRGKHWICDIHADIIEKNLSSSHVRQIVDSKTNAEFWYDLKLRRD